MPRGESGAGRPPEVSRPLERGEPSPPSPPSTLGGLFACLVLGVFFGFGGCHGEPTKSQYVSAVVRQECGTLRGTDAQSCRIGVVKRFSDVPFEQMKAEYPPPPPPSRPSCSLW